MISSMWMELVAVLVALGCVVAAYFHYMYGYWARRGIPYMPPQFPFGNTRNMLLQKQSLGETMQDIYNYFKKREQPFGGYFILSNPQLILIDPEVVKDIMSRDFPSFSDRIARANEKREPLTGNLLALTGTKWKNMRQKVTPTFTSGKMKLMFQTILACCEGLETILQQCSENNEDIDIKDMLGRFTTDIIGSCAFGLECNSLKDTNSSFRQFGRKVFEPSRLRSFKGLVTRTFPALSNVLQLRVFDKNLSDFFIGVVADTIKYREDNNVQRNDFLQLLINIRNTGDVDAKQMNGAANGKQDQQGLTLGEIAAQSFLFFLAGFETSSTAMSFFLFDVAKDQEVQDKVRQEIRDMLARYEGKLTYDGIMELQYLEMALFESMRLHSAVPILNRRCTKEYTLRGGGKLYPGDVVTISIVGLQRDPDYYPEPERFDPQRFSPEQREQRHAYTFLPFGEGPRICIGQRFGLLQTKVGLITLLKNYRFTLSSKTQDPLVMDPKSLLSQAVGGIWMKAERI